MINDRHAELLREMAGDANLVRAEFTPDQVSALPECFGRRQLGRSSHRMKFNLPSRLIFNFLFAVLLMAASFSRAAIIGTNPPAMPLTLARIGTLPAAQQPAWQEYLERSARQMAADQNFLTGSGEKSAANTSTYRS